MSNQSKSSSNLEQKLNALYAVDPAGDFVNRLEKDLATRATIEGTTSAARGSQARGIRVPRRVSWLRLALAVAGLLLALAIVTFITPQGRAWAQSALHFFTRTESDTIPAPTDQPLVWVEQTPGMPVPTRTPLPATAPFAAECGDYRDPHCSIEQIRGMVAFTVKELANIPEGVYFIGATGGPEEVFISYRGDHDGSLALIEQPWTSSSEEKSFEVAPGVAVETVPIGGVTGEYVQGSFGYRSGETVESWKPGTGQETLKWLDQDVYYTLIYLSTTTPLGKEGLAALAESLTTAPVSANLAPMPATATPAYPEPDENRWIPYFPLTVAQASEQAGFNVLAPAKLPEILSFVGASYDAEHNLVELFYLLDQNICGSCDNHLSLLEQPASNGEDCDLCGFVVGDDAAANAANYLRAIVGAEAIIETVQIGDVVGLYVAGGWRSNNVSGMTWFNDSLDKRLRWQKDGMAFELVDVTWELEKEDLIAIAESMR